MSIQYIVWAHLYESIWSWKQMKQNEYDSANKLERLSYYYNYYYYYYSNIQNTLYKFNHLVWLWKRNLRIVLLSDLNID
jgi:hypothetical protein